MLKILLILSLFSILTNRREYVIITQTVDIHVGGLWPQHLVQGIEGGPLLRLLQPALQHDGVHLRGADIRPLQPVASHQEGYQLTVADRRIGGGAQGADLPEHHAVRPHIALAGVNIVANRLDGEPSQGQL